MFLTQCRRKIIKPCWKVNIDLVKSRFFLVSVSNKYRDIHFLPNLLGLSWKSWEYRQKLCVMAVKRQTAMWHPREESLPRMLWCQAYKGMFFFLFKTSNHRRIRLLLSSSLPYICLFGFCACGCVCKELPMNSWLFVLFWIPYVKDFVLYLICSVWLSLVCCIVVISLITRTRIIMLS